MIVGFDGVSIEDIAARLDLRDPNRRAVAAVAEAFDAGDPGLEIICDLATATGKTYIAAGVIDYLAAAGVRNVLIVCPGTTILSKTVANFTPGHAKFVDGLEVRPTVITAEDFARGSVSEALRSSGEFKLFVFNVQQLLRPTANTSRRVRDYDEHLGSSLYEHLRAVEDLVVIADEHHSYFGPQFSRAVRDLSPRALVGLTATPHAKTRPEQIVFHYPLAEAIADGYVKIPVLVARRDGSADIRRQLADGVVLLRHKAAALAAWAAQTGTTAVNPVMFLVCATITEADEVAEILTGPDLLGDADAVLTVTSDSPDTALAALAKVEDPDSPVRAIASVQMLKEGWDVKNIYVVCALRALESQALSEQVLGRGLRLPFGQRTGRQMLDTVEVLSHRRFRDLLAEAGTLLEAFFTERHPAHLVAPDAPDALTEAQAVDAAATDGRLDVLVPPTAGVDPSGEPVEGGLLGAAVEDIERRIAETEQQALALTTTMDLVAGARRVRFPASPRVSSPSRSRSPPSRTRPPPSSAAGSPPTPRPRSTARPSPPPVSMTRPAKASGSRRRWPRTPSRPRSSPWPSTTSGTGSDERSSGPGSSPAPARNRTPSTGSFRRSLPGPGSPTPRAARGPTPRSATPLPRSSPWSAGTTPSGALPCRPRSSWSSTHRRGSSPPTRCSRSTPRGRRTAGTEASPSRSSPPPGSTPRAPSWPSPSSSKPAPRR